MCEWLFQERNKRINKEEIFAKTMGKLSLALGLKINLEIQETRQKPRKNKYKGSHLSLASFTLLKK